MSPVSGNTKPVFCIQTRESTTYTKVKVKVHTLNIAPLRSESPPQKRSDMARVLKGFHTFTCTPTRSSAIGMSHTCLCFPSYSWYSFTDPGGMEGLSRPWYEVAQAKIRTCNLSIANLALYHTATSAPNNGIKTPADNHVVHLCRIAAMNI